MSTVHLSIENITYNFDSGADGIRTQVYSVIDSMKCYRIEIVEDCQYEAYSQEGDVVEDEDLSAMLIDQVIEYKKGE